MTSSWSLSGMRCNTLYPHHLAKEERNINAPTKKSSCTTKTLRTSTVSLLMILIRTRLDLYFSRVHLSLSRFSRVHMSFSRFSRVHCHPCRFRGLIWALRVFYAVTSISWFPWGYISCSVFAWALVSHSMSYSGQTSHNPLQFTFSHGNPERASQVVKISADVCFRKQQNVSLYSHKFSSRTRDQNIWSYLPKIVLA